MQSRNTAGGKRRKINKRRRRRGRRGRRGERDAMLLPAASRKRGGEQHVKWNGSTTASATTPASQKVVDKFNWHSDGHDW